MKKGSTELLYKSKSRARERERERVSFNSTHAHTERPQFSGRQSAIFSTVKSFSLSLSKHSFSWISFFCFHQSHWFFSFCFLLSLTFSPLLFLSHWFIKQNFIFFVHFVNTHLDLEAKGERACEVGVSHGSSSSKTRRDKPPSNGPTSRLGILYWLKPILGYGQRSFLFTTLFLQSLIY